ncbi:hypothetical protein M427DRAFT_260271 [Gonapodya prolifera JEL478]|uniref:Uncharacterized protein n=1 Tax=Gonapodya prolifera (strain JEL478) TaxID=1344416 RepID=A0A139ALQ9_GONPJ|nr:hypothetical protein M427DRAFT_260271 [Gonapodya prolifera JEL478]|eukprot:KXS17375.1 hypothetical protein M427DRAFT_260271 [Gonapodya prolifera JEL478]
MFASPSTIQEGSLMGKRFGQKGGGGGTARWCRVQACVDFTFQLLFSTPTTRRPRISLPALCERDIHRSGPPCPPPPEQAHVCGVCRPSRRACPAPLPRRWSSKLPPSPSHTAAAPNP